MVPLKQIGDHAVAKVNELQAASILNEIRYLATCQHPNLIQIFGTFATEPACSRRRSPSPGAKTKDSAPRAAWLLVLEFCGVGSLTEYVSSRGHLDLHMGQVVSTSLLSAAAYLHNKQIWHRDIRPQNVLLNMQGKELRRLGE